MVHGVRCASAVAQAAALTAFDSLVRGCFAGMTGLHFTEHQWSQASQASRGFAQAGLGLRCPARHAAGAVT